jgi:hypothetical protein
MGITQRQKLLTPESLSDERKESFVVTGHEIHSIHPEREVISDIKLIKIRRFEFWGLEAFKQYTVWTSGSNPLAKYADKKFKGWSCG